MTPLPHLYEWCVYARLSDLFCDAIVRIPQIWPALWCLQECCTNTCFYAEETWVSMCWYVYVFQSFIARLDWVDLILYDTIVRFPRMCVVLTMQGGKAGGGMGGSPEYGQSQLPRKGGRIPHEGKHGGVWIKWLLLLGFLCFLYAW